MFRLDPLDSSYDSLPAAVMDTKITTTTPALALSLSLLLLPIFSSLAEKPTPKLEAKTNSAASGEIHLDQNRGEILLSADNGQYEEKNHFAYWNWDFETKRPGTYEVRVIYTSIRVKKMGLQFRLDDDTVLKSYVYRSRKPDSADEYVLGRARIDTKGKHHITLLSGDKSKLPPFSIKGLKLVPTQEGDEAVGQGLDGGIELHARDATTHSEKMQYEHKTEKNCLGSWVQPEDWAEWDFHVSMPGIFKVSLKYGCGNNSGGSEVALLIGGEQVSTFKVVATGGFQDWQTIDLATVDLTEEGAQQLAIQPLNKAGKAVMDIRKIVLTPVK